MKYHNDYDIRKSKNLFKWQRWVLNQVCDQMSRFEKNKSILNLSKKMKKEIEKIQFDQQLTTLFIDVNRSSSVKLMTRMNVNWNNEDDQDVDY
jgi:hypothetical protein